MKVIKPISVDSGVLFNSNIPEPDPNAGEVEYVQVNQGGGTIGDNFNYGPHLKGAGKVVGFLVFGEGSRYVAQLETIQNRTRILIHKFNSSNSYVGYFITNDIYVSSRGLSIDVDSETEELGQVGIVICAYSELDELTVDKYRPFDEHFNGSVRPRHDRSALLNTHLSDETGILSYARSYHTTGQPQHHLIYSKAHGVHRCMVVRGSTPNISSSLVSDNVIGAVTGDVYTCSIEVRSGKYLIFSRNSAGNTTYIQEYNSSFSNRTKISTVERLTAKTQFGTYTGSEYYIGTSSDKPYSEFTGYKIKANYQYGEVDPGDPVPAGSVFIKTSSHKKYQAVADTILDPLEGLLTVPPEWVELGPTNKYSAFDGVISNQAVYQNLISYTLKPSKIVSSISGFNIDGANKITITQKDSSGNMVYQKEVPMRDNSNVTDWYQYYFSPFIEIDQFNLNELRPYSDSEVSVEIESSGTLGVGEIVIGVQADIGVTNYGSSLQLLDFSRKERDEFGNFNVIRRGTSKLVNYDVSIAKNRINYVFKTISELSTIPCVWVGVDEFNDATTVYGYYKDSTLNIDAPTMCSATITVEGLI